MIILEELPEGYISDIIALADKLNLAQWTYKSYQDEASNANSIKLIMIDEHENLLAFLIGRCSNQKGNDAELFNIGVIPGFQRRGIASKLLERFLKLCSGTVWLEVRESNSSAVEFYQKHNFKVTGKRNNYYTLPTENALVMCLRRD